MESGLVKDSFPYVTILIIFVLVLFKDILGEKLRQFLTILMQQCKKRCR